MTTILNDDYLTVAEAAAYLKVSPSTIWRWINQGSLHAFRVGQRNVRLKKIDLAKLVSPARAENPDTIFRKELERLARPLTKEEKRNALEAIEQAKKLQQKMLRDRGGKLFESSHTILDELRDERTREPQ